VGDFNDRILHDVDHRPWPMPTAPWIMTQTWHDLLFAHWPVKAATMASMIPPGLALDLSDGMAWLGIVPFRMSNVSLRGLPALPWLSAFPELNVRTYVQVGGRPGVYFFSLDASNPLAVIAARTFFHLPYYRASIHVEVAQERVGYDSRRCARRVRPARLRGTYWPTGSTFLARPGTLEYFLTERYCLYTFHRGSHVATVDIHHPPWSLQPACAEFEVNTMAEAARIPLEPVRPILHFAKRQDVVAWPLRSVPAAARAS
jgi:uncharacterized protein